MPIFYAKPGSIRGSNYIKTTCNNVASAQIFTNLCL